jgi:hypothetical protein
MLLRMCQSSAIHVHACIWFTSKLKQLQRYHICISDWIFMLSEKGERFGHPFAFSVALSFLESKDIRWYGSYDSPTISSS